MGDLYNYLWIVFVKRWAGMFALLIGIDEFLEWLLPQYRDWLDQSFSQETRRKFLWRTLLIFVFLSGLLAWKEENADYLKSQNDLIEAQKEIALLKDQPRIGEEAQAKIDSLIQTNQQLQHEVEKLRVQAAAMQADVAPRRIKDTKRFISVLSLFRGQKVDVEYVAGDWEAENFFNEICFVVGFSGLVIENLTAMGGQTWNGVIIEVTDLREAMPAAYELARLLREQGTAAFIKPRSGSSKPGRFAVRVGYKIPGGVDNSTRESQ